MAICITSEKKEEECREDWAPERWESYFMERLRALGMDEILSELLSDPKNLKRLIRVYVEGKHKEDIIRSLTEDYFDCYEPPENYYVFSEKKQDADLILIQVSEPCRRRSSYAIETLIDVDMDVSLRGRDYHTPKKSMFVHQEKDILDIDIWEYLSDELAAHMRTKGFSGASIPELEIESERLGWTMPLTRKERSAICSKSKRKLRKTIQPKEHEEIHLSAGWLGLRELFAQHLTDKGLSKRDTMIISRFYVPDFAGMKKTELREILRENEDFPDPSILQPAHNQVINRNKLTNSEIGNLTERFTHSFLDPSLEAFIGPRPSGVCDISDHKSGLPSKVSWALNVKCSLEADEVNRSYECSPEHKVGKSWILLVLPRQLQMRLYRIESDHMTVNSRSGGLCVRPEELADTVAKLVSGELVL